MKKISINLRELSNENFIKIPIGQSFSPMDNSEIAENDFLEDAIESSVNEITDYEKIRFSPIGGIDEIIIQFKDSGSTSLNYDYFGHSDDDVKFLRNSFKNSFLKLNFYDSPNPSNRRLAFQSIIYNQLNEDQRNLLDNSLLPVNTMPITYRIVDPITLRNGLSEGFYIYWLNKPVNNSYPINFYMTASYHNALDGKITPLIAYDSSDVIQNPDAPIIPITKYNELNSIGYQLIKLNNNNEYKIFTDNTKSDLEYRTISVSGTKLYINLYIPNIG